MMMMEHIRSSTHKSVFYPWWASQRWGKNSPAEMIWGTNCERNQSEKGTSSSSSMKQPPKPPPSPWWHHPQQSHVSPGCPHGSILWVIIPEAGHQDRSGQQKRSGSLGSHICAHIYRSIVTMVTAHTHHLKLIINKFDLYNRGVFFPVSSWKESQVSVLCNS